MPGSSLAGHYSTNGTTGHYSTSGTTGHYSTSRTTGHYSTSGGESRPVGVGRGLPGAVGVVWQPWGVRWFIALVPGLLLGIGIALTDGAVKDLQAPGAWLVASTVLNSTTLLAALAVFAGWKLRRLVPAAVGAVLALALVVGGYVGYNALIADRYDLHLSMLGDNLGVSLGGVAVAGAALGMVGAFMRQRGLVGFLAAMVLPLVALAEVFWRMGLRPESFTANPWLASAQAAIALGAIASGAGAGYGVRR